MTSRLCSKPHSPWTRAASRALACCLCLMMCACAPVQPWQRGHLAQPRMALDEDPMLTAISQHVYDSKEASSGGIGAAGGGCGCN